MRHNIQLTPRGALSGAARDGVGAGPGPVDGPGPFAVGAVRVRRGTSSGTYESWTYESEAGRVRGGRGGRMAA
ncbi:hypothetical protein NKH77_54455 [Streptomyces sp. M19]